MSQYFYYVKQFCLVLQLYFCFILIQCFSVQLVAFLCTIVHRSLLEPLIKRHECWSYVHEKKLRNILQKDSSMFAWVWAVVLQLNKLNLPDVQAEFELLYQQSRGYLTVEQRLKLKQTLMSLFVKYSSTLIKSSTRQFLNTGIYTHLRNFSLGPSYKLVFGS